MKVNKLKMESIFLELVNKFPKLINITKKRSNKIICYSENVSPQFICSLGWIYKYYFEQPAVIVIPKNKIEFFEKENSTFNENLGDFTVSLKILPGDLETLESNTFTKELVIFGYSDLLFNDLFKINKRRLNTLLKNIKNVVVLSLCSLKCMDLKSLDLFENVPLGSFEGISFSNFLENVSWFDLIDPEPDVYSQNEEAFTELLIDLTKESKRVYLSLNLTPAKLLKIEGVLKKESVVVSRKEDPEAQIIISSSKTTEKTFLTGNYDVYFFAPSPFETDLDFVCQFKDVFSKKAELYIDSSKVSSIEKVLLKVKSESSEPRVLIKDSNDYDSFKELLVDVPGEEVVMASDSWYTFQGPESILKFDLSNLTKKEYDIIREYIKTKLTVKFNSDIKTCQLSTPCSPRDRSRKLNSLSNKLSSFDYRCDVTCEIFSDFSIGVIIWNEVFANRKSLNLNVLKNSVYVYQTTSGKWKYTKIN